MNAAANARQKTGADQANATHHSPGPDTENEKVRTIIPQPGPFYCPPVKSFADVLQRDWTYHAIVIELRQVPPSHNNRN